MAMQLDRRILKKYFKSTIIYYSSLDLIYACDIIKTCEVQEFFVKKAKQIMTAFIYLFVWLHVNAFIYLFVCLEFYLCLVTC